ncbi:MAG: selenium metabolism-associated LysR family transcriptional regulator [Pelovirga sp.]
MTLRQLELFIAVAETGSFSRGGELLSLTQSTVSQHIAALEEEFGTRLLDRISRGVVLTAGGKVFLQQARMILAEVDQLKQAMNRFHGIDHAHLELGASNIPANYLVPRLLPLLKKHYPGISMTVQMGDTQQVLDDIRAQRVELGLVGGRIEDDLYRYTPIMSDELILIVGTDHPLGQVGTISLEQVFELELVVREAGSGTWQSLNNALIKAGCDPQSLHVLTRLGSNEAVRRTVAAGYGCAFVSDLSARESIQRGELRRVMVDGLRIVRQLWLAERAERTSSPAARAVKQLVLEIFGNTE